MPEEFCTFKLRTLTFGDMGHDVKLAQRLLQALGYLDKNGKRCRITGILNSQTLYLITKFQKHNNLVVTRKVDRDTWLTLMGVN